MAGKPDAVDPGRQDAAPQWQAIGLLGVLIFAWGGNYTWITIALRDIGPWTFNAVRYCGAAVLVGAVLALRHGAAHIMPARRERGSLAVIGLLQGAALTVLITFSLKWIESTHTILLIYTNPVWSLLFSACLLGERLTLPSIAAVALGLLGIALLINPFAMPWTATTVPGIVSALAATMGWALGSVLYRRERWQSTFWQQVFWQLAASAVAITLAAAVLERDHMMRPTAQLTAITIYNIVVPTALAYWCWSQALARIRPSAASQILLLSPVFGVAQSHLVLGEPLTPALLASAVCVVAGAALTFWRPAARG
ncbi:MAG TPA: DMT family transporter [Xanthobacteraceae bacterium]|nr:DMT family transporter [Xanthobacteraceae bacterium]